MKKINKITNFLFFIICLIFIIFILLGEVDAQTFNGMIWTNINTPFQGNNNANNFNINGTLPSNLRNKGAGTISFILSLEGKYKVYGISLLLNDTYQCSFGSTMGYNDSSAQVYTYSVVCPVNSTNTGQNHYAIEVTGYSWNNIHYWTTSPYMTWSDFNDSNDYSTILSSINSNVAEMGRFIQYTNTDIYNIRTMLESSLNTINSNNQTLITNIQNQTQQQHQDSQNINNSIQDTNNILKDDDVSGNNSNSSITSIGNTFSNQGDFLLNLLTIPYTLWTSILNVFSNTCTPLDVGTMFNYHLVFPCIELNDFLGGIYSTIIDVIFTAIIYSAFIRRVIKYFRELLTLDDNALITGGVKLW